MSEGPRTEMDGVVTGQKFKEIAEKIMLKHESNEQAYRSEAEETKPAADEGPGVIILSATYIVAIDIGGQDKRQHIVQLVNGKERPDDLEDDVVSLNFFTEPPAMVDDKVKIQETIEKLSTDLVGVKRQLEDAAAVVLKKSRTN